MAYTTQTEGMSYPEYTGIPYTYWTGLYDDPEGTGGYGIVVERRNPEHKEEPSLAHTTWDKILSLLKAINPVTAVEDIINYNNTTNAKNPTDYAWGLIKGRWSRLLGRVSNGLKLANWWSPSMHIGATRDAMLNGFSFRHYGNKVINGNTGLFNEEGFWPTVGNVAFDLVTTSPRAVTSLVDAGTTYLSNLGRHMPPPAGAVAVVDNGVIPIAEEATRFNFPIEGWNGVSTIPAINEGGDLFMAFSDALYNPKYDKYSHDLGRPESYPRYRELDQEELKLMKAWAELNGVDLSKVDITKFYLRFLQLGKSPSGTIVSDYSSLPTIGIHNNRISFNDVAYRYGRLLQELPGLSLDINTPAGRTFLDLGVVGKADNMASISSGRALAADIRAQMWKDPDYGLSILHLKNPDSFEFNSGDLVDLLNNAHSGAYANLDGLSIKGFKRVPVKRGGNTTYRLDWDPNLSDAEIDKITKTWKDAIFYFKSGNKLIPRRVHK